MAKKGKDSKLNRLAKKTKEMKRSKKRADKTQNDLSSELAKEFDRFKIMFDEDAIKRNDLDQFRSDVEKKMKEFTSQPINPELEKRIDYIEKIFKEIKERKVTSEDVKKVKQDLAEIRKSKKGLKQLEEEKMNLEEVMQAAESDYSEGMISEKAYDEITRKSGMRIDEINITLTRTDNEMFGKKVKSIDDEVSKIVERMKGFETKDSLREAREKFASLDERLKHIGNLFTRVSEIEEWAENEKKSKETLTIVLKETRDSIHSFLNDIVEIRKKLTEQEKSHTEKINEKMERLEKVFRKTAEGMANKQELKDFENKMSELIEKNTKIMELLMEEQIPKKKKK